MDGLFIGIAIVIDGEVIGSGIPPVPPGALIGQDGVSFLVAEDGTTILIQE